MVLHQIAKVRHLRFLNRQPPLKEKEQTSGPFGARRFDSCPRRFLKVVDKMLKLMKHKKIIIIIGVVLIISAILLLDKSGMISTENKSTTGKSINQEVKYVPLSQVEIQKVADTILSSEFVKDVPEKDPVALTFFKFENQERVWQDRFLIGKNQLLTEGTPSAYLILNSKYISELNGDNFCDIIKEANKNGDLGFESEYGNVKLLIKYSGMLKHRECFGF